MLWKPCCRVKCKVYINMSATDVCILVKETTLTNTPPRICHITASVVNVDSLAAQLLPFSLEADWVKGIIQQRSNMGNNL